MSNPSPSGWPGTIGRMAITLMVIAGIIGIVLVIIWQAGIVVPSFIITILWIILAVVIGVMAVKFLMSIW